MSSIVVPFTCGVSYTGPLALVISFQSGDSHFICLTRSKWAQVHTNRFIFPECTKAGAVYPEWKSGEIIECVGCDVISICRIIRHNGPAEWQLSPHATHHQVRRGPHRWEGRKKHHLKLERLGPHSSALTYLVSLKQNTFCSSKSFWQRFGK